jgi:SH3 domain-containing YSC84-like protein 1
MLRKLSLVSLLVLPFQAMAAEDDAATRLKASTDVLNEIMASGDKAIPSGLFEKAHCAVVVPSMKKAGFIFSGKYGRGFASCRTASGWSAPAAMRIEGGGFGLQVGGAEADIVMLVMSERGMKGLLSSKFSLGGEASAAAGPVGRDATAQTDATMRADILSWSRSRGVFGGLSLQGGTLRPDEDVNKSMYGKKDASSDVLNGKIAATADASAFVDALTKYGGTQPNK